MDSELQAALDRYDISPDAVTTDDIMWFAEAARKYVNLQTIVDEQAEDVGLWFGVHTVPEAYLQQELRRLHAAIEEAPDGQ